MYFSRAFFLSVLLSFSSGLIGQTVYPGSIDGKIFLKLKDQSALQLAAFGGEKLLREDGNSQPKELAEVFNRYQTRTLSPTFEGSQDPRLSRIYTVGFNQPEEIDAYLAELSVLPYVEYAEKVPLYRIDDAPAMYEPNDRRLFNDMYHLDLIDAAEAWDISRGSEEVIIAIVDDAILVDHEDLKDNIWVNPGEIPGNGVDDDRNGYVDDVNGFDVATGTPNPGGLAQLLTHGTRVAGCAAAATDNGRGVAAIGFNCKIMAVKATANPSSANNEVVTNTFEGVKYAVDARADIVNMSFGGGQRSQTFQELINQGNELGIVFVASSGNTGNDEEQFPAAYDHVISVAATGETDRVTNFSTVHSTVDIAAPGQSIRTTVPNVNLNGYTRTTGTSFSSPIVSGVLGLMKSVNPCATPEELEAILKSSADDISGLNPSFVGKIGAGRVNAAKALEAIAAPSLPTADFTFDNSSICTNRIPFSFVVDPDNAGCDAVNRFNWEVSNGADSVTSASGRTPNIEFPSSGTYEVQLTVSNAAGSSQVSKSVEISINPNAFISAGNDTVVCLGESIQLGGTTTADVVGVQWQPTLGLDDNSSLSPTFQAEQGGGLYKLQVEGADGCILEDSIQIDVFRLPFLRVTPADTTILPGDSVVLEVRGGLFYEWSPGISLSDSTLSTPVAFPSETTTYTIKTIGAGRCESELSYTLNVDSIGVSVLDLLSGARLADPLPNPANDRVSLSAFLPTPTNVSLTCYSLTGKKMEVVLPNQRVQDELRVDWNIPSTLADGVYWMVWEVDGRKLSQPLLIAR